MNNVNNINNNIINNNIVNNGDNNNNGRGAVNATRVALVSDNDEDEDCYNENENVDDDRNEDDDDNNENDDDDGNEDDGNENDDDENEEDNDDDDGNEQGKGVHGMCLKYTKERNEDDDDEEDSDDEEEEEEDDPNEPTMREYMLVLGPTKLDNFIRFLKNNCTCCRCWSLGDPGCECRVCPEDSESYYVDYPTDPEIEFYLNLKVRKFEKYMNGDD